MAKKVINITLKTGDEALSNKLLGVVMDDYIKYRENNILVVIKILKDSVLITRNNDEYQLNLVFKNKTNTKGKYILKENNYNFDLDIYTYILNISNNEIKIKYKLNDETRTFTLNIEE